MAKLGMPSVNIAFQEAGSEAVVRSQRGIAVLILEEDAATITKLSAPRTIGDEKLEALTNPFTVYTTDDIPPELSEDNKDYIVKTLKDTLQLRIESELCCRLRAEKATTRPENSMNR